MEFYLGKFDLPDTYRDHLIRKQRKFELITQISATNYKEIKEQLLPMIPQTLQGVINFCELFIGISKRKSYILHYYMWVLCELLKIVPQLLQPSPVDVLDSSTDIFSYFVKFGIFTPAQYRSAFENICMQGDPAVIRSLIIVSSVFDRQDILNLYLSSNNLQDTNYMHRTRWGTMGSMYSTLPTQFQGDLNMFSEEEEEKPQTIDPVSYTHLTLPTTERV